MPQNGRAEEEERVRGNRLFFLVPRLRLGTHIFRALPGNYMAFWPIMEAEPPGHAFPGGAREREVWHDFFSILSFETAS